MTTYSLAIVKHCCSVCWGGNAAHDTALCCCNHPVRQQLSTNGMQHRYTPCHDSLLSLDVMVLQVPILQPIAEHAHSLAARAVLLQPLPSRPGSFTPELKRVATENPSTSRHHTYRAPAPATAPMLLLQVLVLLLTPPRCNMAAAPTCLTMLKATR